MITFKLFLTGGEVHLTTDTGNINDLPVGTYVKSTGDDGDPEGVTWHLRVHYPEERFPKWIILKDPPNEILLLDTIT